MLPNRLIAADPLAHLSSETGRGDGRPDPDVVATAAEFVEALRRLRSWSGAGFRRLEKRAADLGMALPRSTITAALNRNVLPREELVVALVRACGGDQDDADQYVTVRRRIAASLSQSSRAPLPRSVPPERAVMVRAGRGRSGPAVGAGSNAFEIGMSGEDAVGVLPLSPQLRGDGQEWSGRTARLEVLLTVVSGPSRSTVVSSGIEAMAAIGMTALAGHAENGSPACIIIYV